MSTWQQLLIARDAQAEGRDAEAAVLLEEICDVAHVRFVTRRRLPLKPSFEVQDLDDPDYDDIYEAPYRAATEDEARDDRRAWLRAAARIGWLEWKKSGARMVLGAMDDMLRRIYTGTAIEQLAIGPNPMLALMRRTVEHGGQSDRAVVHPDVFARHYPSPVPVVADPDCPPDRMYMIYTNRIEGDE